ncbi:MAG: ABC transporter permease subunit [Planctomycetota bacterium]
MSAHERKTPSGARGEPAVWLMGASLVVCLALIVGMLALILWQGGRTFWPRPVDRIELASGEVLLAQPMGVEAAETPEGGATTRVRLRVSNRIFGQDSQRDVFETQIVSRERPEWAALVERVAQGAFLGRVEALTELDESGEVVRTVEGDELLAELDAAISDGSDRRSRIERIGREDLGRVARRLESIGFAREEINRRAAIDPASETSLPMWAFAAVVVGGLTAGFGVVRIGTPTLRWLLVAVVVLCGSAAWLEHPWSGRAISAETAEQRLAALDERQTSLESERAELGERLAELRAEDDRYRLVVREVGEQDRLSPRGATEPDEPMRVSQATRVTRLNTLGFGGKLGLYFERWGAFLSGTPLASGEGGVFPVIVGTVTLTLLLVVGVVPLGVVTALYMREYAKQGVLTSAVRIAINNLAGVPSIVYGMFGLGFFCYLLGGYIDGGSGAAALPRGSWWGLLSVFAAMLFLAGACAAWASKPGAKQIAGKLAGVLALGAVVALIAAVWTTPYFGGFFSEKLPERSTFGSKGILWAALTLALLTLPVVIVATEEAIAAVPGSMREGSYGCGASRWQTIRRIVLPAAMPGVITGAILAMARGAGEVAPLILVGAVNLAPESPVSLEAPFLHGDRTFMHLGYHVFNLGFQAPDVDATLPLVWTTTLLLILIVVTMNVFAVWLRGKLRQKLTSSAV